MEVLMADIYQEIWDADQAGTGLIAVINGVEIDDETKTHGYVVVNEDKDASDDHRVIAEVVIPTTKQNSYNLAAKLFNNYTLDQTKPERNFPEEEIEVQEFLDAVYKSAPMQVARNFVADQSGEDVSEDQWWAILQRVWFEQFDDGRNQDLSGFEHVVVGEQKQGKVQGYHFWYKYYMDEQFRRDDGDDSETDLIKFLEWKNSPGDQSPEVVTLSYQWRAFDYEAKKFRKLTKPIGGFWVGPSIEGLLALGTVRFLPEAMAPKKTVINGVKYDLPMFRSPNDRHMRTFYPKFVGMV
jgi:poly(U)-specific endoribonuclease